MDDPVFTTRADLDRWIAAEHRYASNRHDPLDAFEALLEIQRVSRAHAHLLTPESDNG